MAEARTAQAHMSFLGTVWTTLKNPALDSRVPYFGESLDYLNQQEILGTTGAGNSEINATLVAERDIFSGRSR